MVPKVLVADDRRDGVDLVCSVLADVLADCVVDTTVSYDKAMDLVLKADIAIIDNDWSETGSGPRDGGLEILRHAKQNGRPVRGIIMTAFDAGERFEMLRTVFTEQLADDWIPKPNSTSSRALDLFKNDMLRAFRKSWGSVSMTREVSILRETRERDRAELEEKFHALPGSLIGNNPRFLDAVRVALETASSDEPTLVIGESGTGKREIANLIARQADKEPLHMLQPGVRPKEMLYSDLFGYAKNYAAVGADKEGRAGLIEESQGHALLLDDLHRIPLTVQASILNPIDRGEVVRAGESRLRKLNPQPKFIATMGMEPQRAIEEGLLEKDLANRFLLTIRLPAMRDRLDDVLPLLEYECGRRGYIPEILPGAIELIREYFRQRISGNENVRAILAVAAQVERQRPPRLDRSVMTEIFASVGMKYGDAEAAAAEVSPREPTQADCAGEWCAKIDRSMVGTANPVHKDILKHRAGGEAYPGRTEADRSRMGLQVLEDVIESYGGAAGFARELCSGMSERESEKLHANVRKTLGRARARHEDSSDS